ELLVGAPYRYYASRADEGIPPPVACLFHRSAEGWALAQMFKANDPLEADAFGATVALGHKFAAVGAPGDEAGDGPVHTFPRGPSEGFTLVSRADSPDRPRPFGDLLDEYGRSVACDGDVVLVGAPLAEGADGTEQAGAVYVFDARTGGPVSIVR